MKKFIFLFLFVILALGVSACSSKNQAPNQVSQTGEENSVPASSTSYEDKNLADDLAAQNLTTNTNPTGTATSAASSTTMTTKRVLDGQEDLAKEYSSAVMTTTLGKITFKFYGTESPITVNNFMNLAKKGFYDGVIFHRVIKDFMIQGGDPTGTGMGGPGYQFADEFNPHKLVAGSLAMANSGPNTNGSQFFIVTASATPWLDGVHTNFGEVVSGMDVVNKISNTPVDGNDKPLTEVKIEKIELVK